MSLRNRFLRSLSYAWASPNTLLGLVVGAPAFFGGRAAWVDGVLELSGPGLAFLLGRAVPLRGGALAMTLGHVVVAQDESAMQRCRAHERVHVRQYEHWGPLFLPAYFAAGAVAFLRGKHPYLDNPFEVEAREAEAATCGTGANRVKKFDSTEQRSGK